MIAYLEPAQFLGTFIIGVGLGIMLTRAYDAIRHRAAMRRIGRNVKAYAAGWTFDGVPATQPYDPTAFQFDDLKTSGPEKAPANRDPQEPIPTTSGSDAGVAVQSADAGEGVAPPARSFNSQGFTSAPPWDGEWHTDWTADGRQQ